MNSTYESPRNQIKLLKLILQVSTGQAVYCRVKASVLYKYSEGDMNLAMHFRGEEEMVCCSMGNMKFLRKGAIRGQEWKSNIVRQKSK